MNDWKQKLSNGQETKCEKDRRKVYVFSVVSNRLKWRQLKCASREPNQLSSSECTAHKWSISNLSTTQFPFIRITFTFQTESNYFSMEHFGDLQVNKQQLKVCSNFWWRRRRSIEFHPFFWRLEMYVLGSGHKLQWWYLQTFQRKKGNHSVFKHYFCSIKLKAF